MATKKKTRKKAARKKPATRKKPARRKAAAKQNGTDWPADKIERRKVADLVPYARNSRTHSAEQVDKLAASIREWGWTVPVLISEDDTIIAGHGRVLAAQKLEIDAVPCIVAKGWSEAQVRAYALADNQLPQLAGWDIDMLRVELGDLDGPLGFDLSLVGFEQKTIDDWLGTPDGDKADELAAADEFDVVKDAAVSRRGDLWLLGSHRLLCGDSTAAVDVQRVMADELADLVHADPPYGMGKEADGIANDNLRQQKLDAFQMQWVKLALEHAQENCGLYIWGNAPDLFRLWFAGGLAQHDELTFRNEIAWAKGSGFGMKSEGQHSFTLETERCLFVMRGQQFLGNQNLDDYWEGYEPLRLWMVAQRKAAGWTSKQVNEITGTHMAGHWFGKSQFHPIAREQYEKLRSAAGGDAFSLTYDELGKMFSTVREGGNEHRRGLSAEMREGRTFFDNTHDVMTDIWKFGRVAGEERYGHATPKPVQMIGRAVRTSCPEGGLVLEPFLGTGTTLMAAEILGRRCFGLELEPLYVDVIVRRWQEKTGASATLDGSGDTFAAVAHERAE